MNPIGMFENPGMAEQQMLNQLGLEQQQFWYQFNVRPPQNDLERQQAISALTQRYGQLSVLQGDAMFLNSQGFGRLLAAVNFELNAMTNLRNQYVNALQAPPPPPPSPPRPPAADPDDLINRLKRSSEEQDIIRRRMVGDCIHCGRPTEGRSLCPHCGRYQ